MKMLVKIVYIGSVLAFVLVACANPEAASEDVGNMKPTATLSTSDKIGNEVGSHAPELSLTFLDGTNIPINWTSETRKPVFLYFFTTW